MTAPSLTAACPAKINLYLDVLGKRQNGFHDLDSIFLAIDLEDRLTVEASAGEADSLIVDGPFGDSVPTDDSNLVLRAAALLRREIEIPALRFLLEKNIPSGAGLGGGSSDGATALRMANRLAAEPVSEERLLELSAELGSDCTFFLGAPAARVGGRGERLRPLPVQRDLAVLLVVPDVSVPTWQAFGWLKGADKGPRTGGEAVERWLAGDAAPLPRLQNSFQRAVCERTPAVAEALDELARVGSSQPLLSGSGSACFAVFDRRTDAERAAAEYSVPARLLRVVGVREPDEPTSS